MPLEEYQKISELIENDVYEVLPPKACAFIRKTTGGPSPIRVKEQIQDLCDFVKLNIQGKN
jgi:argininosuccinate lyase